jgi:hypothetical protein
MTNEDIVRANVTRYIAEYESIPLWEQRMVHGEVLLKRMLDGVIVKKHRGDSNGWYSMKVDVSASKDKVGDIVKAVIWVQAQASASRF